MFLILGGFILGSLFVKFIFDAIDFEVPVSKVPPGARRNRESVAPRQQREQPTVAYGRTVRQYQQ